MKTWSLGHLADHELLLDLTALAARDRTNTAELLAHIAEVDERKLYVPAAYTCMRDWCVGELRMSEDAAAKRIHVARIARRLPVLFVALADGRLHLSGLAVLASHLTDMNVEELIAAATHQSKKQIEEILAQRFPTSERLALVTEVAGQVVDPHAPGHVQSPDILNAPGHPTQTLARAEPRSSGSFAMDLTVSRETRDKIEYARALLSHAMPSGDYGAVIDRALDALIAKLEQKKFGVTSRAHSRSRKSVSSRYIPTQVRQAVFKRDGGRCTFTSDCGRRCNATTRLEFDHETPVARGGQSTVSNLRLRCRVHNQHAAEQVYGKAFMQNKRRAAGKEAPKTRASQETPPQVADAAVVAVEDYEDDLISWLRMLGYSPENARFAVAKCGSRPTVFPETRRLECLAVLANAPRGLVSVSVAN